MNQKIIDKINREYKKSSRVRKSKNDFDFDKLGAIAVLKGEKTPKEFLTPFKF